MVRAYQSGDRASGTCDTSKLEQLSFKNSQGRDSPMGDRKRLDLLNKQPNSPLLMMQKNYQERIYAEKEKKMIEIFKKNQQSSLQTISDKSSKEVKSYFGRKLEHSKKDKISENGYQKDPTMVTQKMLAKHLPPLVKNRKADNSHEDGDKVSLVGNEGRGVSKRLSRLTIHKSKVNFLSNEQTMNGQSPVNPIPSRDGRFNDFSNELDESRDKGDSMNEVNRDCLRLIRDKRIKEKKQELLKSNNRRMASCRDEVHDTEADQQNKFSTPKEDTHVHRKSRRSKISTFHRPRDSPRPSPVPANSNVAADTSKITTGGGQTSNGNEKYGKPSRNRPFVSISPEEREEINFNETYSKHKRKVDPNPQSNDISKENNPIFGIPNFNKPVKVRRDGRNTSNSTYSAKHSKPQDTAKTNIAATTTSEYYNHKQEKNARDDDEDTAKTNIAATTTSEYYNHKQEKNARDDDEDTAKTNIAATTTSEYYNHKQEKNARDDDPKIVPPSTEIVENNPQKTEGYIEDYEEVELQPCDFCGRKFAVDRLDKHKSVCVNLKKKQRGVYNMVEARQKGTDLEKFRKPQINSAEIKPKKADWRVTHDDLIKTIKHARTVTAHVASGGRAIDMPPPPPSSNPDYVHCQYCDRKFAPAVAERHIPKCKEIKARPPPPKRIAKGR